LLEAENAAMTHTVSVRRFEFVHRANVEEQRRVLKRGVRIAMRERNACVKERLTGFEGK